MNRATAAFMEELNKGGRAAGDYAQAQHEAATNTAEDDRKRQEVEGKVREAVEKTRAQLEMFGTSLFKGGEGTAKYGGVVTGASDVLADLSGKMGIFGIALGGIIKLIGGLAVASLKQNDAVMKSYRDLSEMGSVSGSLEKLKDDLGKVGLTTDELDKFGGMIKKTAPELAAFGGSVSAGKDKLIGVIQGMIGPNNEIERAMARIGYGAEEMRDATADYIAKQSRLGLSQGKTEESLRKESVKYMETLRELQELTGMSRDEAQKVMDNQLKEYRFAEYIRELTLAGKEKEAANIQKYMGAYEKTYGSANANDLKEQIINKGAAATEGAIRSSLSTQNQGYENAMKAQKGQIDVYDGLKNTAIGMRKNMDALNPSYNVMGQGLNQLSASNEGLLGMQMMEGKTREEIAERLKETEKNAGKRLEDNVVTEQQNRALRIAADKALWEIGDKVVSSFRSLNEIMNTFAKTVAKMVDWINKTIFRNETHYADQFKDKMDYQGDLNVAKNALADAEKEKIKLQSDLAKYSQDTSGEALKTAIAAAKKGAKDNFYYKNAETGEETGNAEQAALYQAEVKHLEDLQKQIAKKDGTIDKEKVQQLEKDKINSLDKKIASDKQKLLDAEKKLLEYEGKSGEGAAGAGATGSGVGSGGPTTINKQDGTKEVREGGSISWRNNNPGNVRAGSFAKEHGAIGEAGGFAVFPDEATGEKARADLLFGSASKYRELSLKDAIYRYAPPSENDSKAYLETILKATGAREDTRMNDLRPEQQNALLLAMKKHEGWKEGKVHQAETGGIFDGPKTGYPVVLHGNEAVIPMPNLQDFTESVRKENLGALKGMDTGNKESVIQKVESGINPELMQSMMTMMASKFDEMIRHLDNSHSTQQQILTYTKA
jgi:hypothetical protein